MGNSNNIDFTTPRQKMIARGVLVIGAVVLWFLLPSLIWFFENLIWLGVLCFVVLIAALNYDNIWEFSKQLTWNITKNRIASDKIYYMWKYYDHVLKKKEALDKSIINVSAIASKIDRKLTDVIINHKKNKEKALELEKQEKSELVINTAYQKVKIDQDTIDSLTPKLEGIRVQEKYLQDLSDAWGADNEKLKYTLEAKEEEYLLLKELAETTNSVAEFTKGNSKEAKEFAESLKQLETSCNLYIGTIDNFQRKVDPLMENLSTNQSIDANAGKALLEEYKKERVDFSTK